ncbi:hypothetical protein GCM10027073_56640 [Streptomyces chlorus]
MGIDFSTFSSGPAPTPTDPRVLFDALPDRAARYEFLRDPQGQVLQTWYDRRSQKDSECRSARRAESHQMPGAATQFARRAPASRASRGTSGTVPPPARPCIAARPPASSMVQRCPTVGGVGQRSVSTPAPAGERTACSVAGRCLAGTLFMAMRG